jgi:hypothetical protein
MSILTDDLPIAEGTEYPPDPRAGLMHALAVAEMIASRLPVAPYHVALENLSPGFENTFVVKFVMPPGVADFRSVQTELGGLQAIEIDEVRGVEARRRVLTGAHLGVAFVVSSALHEQATR